MCIPMHGRASIMGAYVTMGRDCHSLHLLSLTHFQAEERDQQGAGRLAEVRLSCDSLCMQY